MLSEDFTAFAGRIHIRFERSLEAEALKKLVAATISGIASDCVKAGSRLIGHIKCIAEDDWLEDHGMHGDDRMTCHRHQCWTEDCPGEHS